MVIKNLPYTFMILGLVFQSFRTEGVVEIIKLLCGRRYPRWNGINNHIGTSSSVLVSIPLPNEFVVIILLAQNLL